MNNKREAVLAVVYMMRFVALLLLNGARAAVIAWYATMPPERIDGASTTGAIIFFGVIGFTFLEVGLLALFRLVIKELE